MKPIGPVILALAGIVLAWIALATESPVYDAQAAVAPESVPVALSGKLPAGHVVRTLDIDGLCCAGCVGKLYVALHEIDAVREVAVDAEEKVAQAVVPRDLDVTVLEDALTFDKYTAHLASERL